MSFRDRRGQVSAPIELFVAVIIMSFSMALALYVYNQFSAVQCEYRVRSQNERLQEAFQEVAISSWGTSKTIDYTMERCGTRPVDAVRFVHYPQAKYCGRCPGSYSGCWIIEPLTYDPGSGVLAPITDASVCVSLAESLKLDGQRTSDCTVDVVKEACPQSVGNKQLLELAGDAVISRSACVDSVKTTLSSAVYDAAGAQANTDWATFGRTSGGSDYFKIRITKGESAAAGSGAAGQLLICASQTRSS